MGAGEVVALARQNHRARAGIIDVGSNSVRFVVFDGLRRHPLPVFNERVSCALGAGLHKKGTLSTEGRAKALAALARFARLADSMSLGSLEVVATAAVRDALDGPDFVAEVAELCGLRIRVLSGAEEARMSASGVLSGMPGAEGLMGDLGGGSLELVSIVGGQAKHQATMPLGQLRLKAIGARDRRRALREIDDGLSQLDWLATQSGRPIYAVGGGWRSLARIHMHWSTYHLRIIDGYRIGGQEAKKFLDRVAKSDRAEIASVPRISRPRIDFLPYAAIAMRRVIEAADCGELVFSAYGLREGWLYDNLAAEVREQDPLITACRDLAALEGRFPEHGQELAAWTAPLFEADGPERERLRFASCLLSDIAWRAHPDHRAEEAMLEALWAPLPSVDHAARAFIALSVYARYTGRAPTNMAEWVASLIKSGAARRARQLGLALRLGHTITGGAPGLLHRFRLRSGRKQLLLEYEDGEQVLLGDAVRARFERLAEAVEKTPEIRARD